MLSKKNHFKLNVLLLEVVIEARAEKVMLNLVETR